jgi:hypothetical protein
MKQQTEFWGDFIKEYLLPLETDPQHEKKVRVELLELRNKVLQNNEVPR